MSDGYINELRREIKGLKTELAEAAEREDDASQTIESLEEKNGRLKERLADLEGQANE